MEDPTPKLAEDIRALTDPHDQTDAPLKTALAYTRQSGQSMRAALASEQGWSEVQVPAVRTMTSILIRGEKVVCHRAGPRGKIKDCAHVPGQIL